MKKQQMVYVLAVVLAIAGCTGLNAKSDEPGDYQFPDLEAEWIRNGEPLEFEGQLWYPQDIVDVLLDSEVLPVGKYRDVELFIEKADVRPYHRIYTKFGERTFRIFRKKPQRTRK